MRILCGLAKALGRHSFFLMTRAITLALVLIVAVAGPLAMALNNVALGAVATVALLLLVAAAAGAGRVAAKCDHLKGRAGTLHIWGAAPHPSLIPM